MTDTSSSSSSVIVPEAQSSRKTPARARGGAGRKNGAAKRSAADTIADDPKVGSKRGVQQVQTPEIPNAKVSTSKLYYKRLPAVLYYYHETRQRTEQLLRELCSDEDFQTVQQFLSAYRQAYLSQVRTRCFLYFMKMQEDAETEASRILDRYDLMMMARIRQYVESIKEFEAGDDYALDWDRLTALWNTIESRKDAPPDLASAVVLSALGDPTTLPELDIAVVKLASSGVLGHPSALLDVARAKTLAGRLAETEVPDSAVKRIIELVDTDLKRQDSEGRPELWCDLRSIEDVRHFPVLRTMSELMNDLGVRD